MPIYNNPSGGTSIRGNSWCKYLILKSDEAKRLFACPYTQSEVWFYQIGGQCDNTFSYLGKTVSRGARQHFAADVSAIGSRNSSWLAETTSTGSLVERNGTCITDNFKVTNLKICMAWIFRSACISGGRIELVGSNALNNSSRGIQTFVLVCCLEIPTDQENR